MMMMMNPACAAMCAVLAMLGAGGVLFAAGGGIRWLQARMIVAGMKRRGASGVQAVFFGNPGDGWLAVTVEPDDKTAAPYAFQVPDHRATLKGVLEEWNRARPAAEGPPAAA